MFNASPEPNKLLNHRPSIAYFLLLLVALSAWCLHDMSRLVISGGLVVWIISVSRFSSWLLKPSFRQFFWICISLFFGVYFLSGITLSLQTISIFSLQFVNAAGISLVCLIALQWVSWRSSKFDWLLLSIGLLVIVSGISWQTHQHKIVFAGLVFCFVMVLFVMRLFPRFRLHQPNSDTPKKANPQNLWVFSGVHWIMFLMVFSLSLVFSKSIEFADQRFDEMLTDFLLSRQETWSGFSGQTVLGSSQNISLSEEVALSVEAEKAIDYWRGNVLTYYQGGRWSPQEILHLPPHVRRLSSQEQEYSLNPTKPVYMQANIEMHRNYQGILFLPYQSQSLIIKQTSDIYQNQYQLFRHELKDATQQYRLHLDPNPNGSYQTPAQWDQNVWKENLQIDDNVKKSLKPLALNLTQDQRDPMQKAQILEQWFHQNFHYSLQTTATQFGVDPTVDFVLNRKAAYCSWFASGMVLMLRSIGIPAHLVSGWRSMEWNPWVQKWIIKEKQAHDWVEVLDADHNQWVRFDPTPTAQLNQLIQTSSWPMSFLKNMELIWHDLSQDVIQMNLTKLVQTFKNIVLTLIQQPLFGILLIVWLALKLLEIFKKSRAKITPVALPVSLDYTAVALDLRRDWQRFTAYLAAKQIELPSHQPLEVAITDYKNRFTDQEYQTVVRWIQLFQLIRFGPASEPEHQEFKDLLQELENSTRSQATNTIQ